MTSNTVTFITVAVSSVISPLAPVHTLLICCFTFIIINFICEVLVSLKRYMCSGRRIKLRDFKLQYTFFNLIFSFIGVD